MSQTIDQRVVQMKFDNSQFERNATETLSTLDKLKEKLNFKGASEGLERVGKAANGTKFDGMNRAVDTVKDRFSALEVFAITALVNISNSAFAAGKKIVSALTIDPIKTGFQEYETQINAIQTIMANTSSKGTSLQQVNAALNELNHYADKTIYNFTEMTRNIGTFTAAGVDLDTSVSAIKGIANLAAVSGSTSQQASTAMYQLSQALASGTVKLMDWNSVVNAGMGGQVFQDALKETARAHGITIDEMIDKEGSFRETLSQGWLTSEVLTDTLAKFTGDLTEAQLQQQGYNEEQIKSILSMGEMANDAATKVKTLSQLIDTTKEAAQSGWTKSWELIIGDFEEAKELYTELSTIMETMLNSSSDARNKLLSDGLSSGWKQLLEKGLDEEAYISKVKKVAEEHGVNMDKMIEDTGSFEKALKQGLKDGSINSDILKEAVKQLTEEVNGLSEQEALELGYTEEDVRILNELNEGLQNGSISMEEYAQKMQQLSGRENLIQSLRNTFEGLQSVVTPIKEAFTNIFPPMTGEQLYDLTAKLESFTSKLKLSDKNSENLKRTFEGLFSIFSIVGKAIEAVVRSVFSLGEGTGTLASNILEVTAKIGDWLKALNESVESSDIFNKTMGAIVKTIKEFAKHLVDAFSNVKEVIKGSSIAEVFTNIAKNIKTRIDDIIQTFKQLTRGTEETFSKAGDSISNSPMVKALETLWEVVKKIASGVSKLVGDLMKNIASAFGSADFNKIGDLINTVIGALIGLKLVEFTDIIKNLSGLADNLKESVVGTLNSVRETFEAYQTKLKADVLMKLAGAIAVLTASIVVISSIDSGKLNTAMGAITMMFAQLLTAMGIFTKLNLKPTAVAKNTALMLAMSTSLLILAGALKKLGELDWGQIAVGLTGLAGATAILVTATKSLSNSQGIMQGATQMVIFAAAINVMASAVKKLAELNFEELMVGLTGISVIMGAVSLFLNTTKTSKLAISTAAGIVILAASMKIFASAVKDFASIGDPNELVKGIAGIGAILAELAIFTKLTGNATNVMSTGASLILIGAAMKIFASAIKDITAIGDLGEIGKGLLGLGGALGAVAIAMNALPEGMMTKAVGLTIVASSLLILAQALQSMGNMEWNEIAKGLVALGGSLVILAVALNAMTGTLAGSAALLVASAALNILTPVLKSLGDMTIGEIAKSLIVLAGALTVIGIAGAVLTPVIPSIIGLAGSIALFGVGIAAIGGGLVLIGSGLSAMAVGIGALAVAAGAGLTAVTASITAILIGIAEAIPEIIKNVGQGIVELIRVIGDSAQEIGESIKKVLLAAIDVAVEVIPQFVEGLMSLISQVLQSLTTHAPEIIDYILEFLIQVISGVTQRMPELVGVVTEAVSTFFSSVINEIKGMDTSTLIETIAGIGLISGIMLALSAAAALVPGAMLGVLGMAGVVVEIGLLLAALGALSQIPGLNWLIEEGSEFLSNIGNAIGSFVGSIIGGVMEGVTASFPQIGKDLSDFMTNLQPFAEGAKNIDSSIITNMQSLAGAILVLTAANIVDGLASFFTGESSLTRFGKELAEFGPLFSAYYQSVSGIDSSVVTASTAAAMSIAEFANNIPNQGGLASLLKGDNSISKFAQELSTFGPAMKTYADSVKGLDGNVVTNSINAAKSLSELAKNLPNQGGLKALFTGDASLGSFGDSLIKFGTAMKSYSDNVGGINPGALSAVSDEIKKLIAVAKGMQEVDGSAMSKFAQNLTDLGKAGIDGFIKAFTDATSRVKETADTMIKTFIDTVEGKRSEFKNKFDELVKDALKMINDKQNDFKKAINDIMKSLIDGVNQNGSKIKQAFTKALTDSINAMRQTQGQFRQAGLYLTQGVANGISSGTAAVVAQARSMAQRAANAARSQLQIRSPSRVGMEIGNYFGLGFVYGIADNIEKAGKTSSEMAMSAMDGLGNAISSAKIEDLLDIDANPVITPILDLSDVEKSAGVLEQMLSNSDSLSMAQLINVANGYPSTQDETANNVSQSQFLGRQYPLVKVEKMEVRSEQDIHKVAKELNNMIYRYSREEGVTI